jgi:sortase (surface protein transpeptidase)
VGHVDSYSGPAVFYRLSGVRLGEKVQVVRADGSTSAFTIGKITVVSKTDFPSRAVFARTRRDTIRLITCTGPFDTHTSNYSDSLIVWGQATPSWRPLA